MARIIKEVKGTAMPFLESDTDTDIIIPSRYLLTLTWKDVAPGLLYSRRFDKDGNKIDSPLNDPNFAGTRVMLGGSNFGCGSSREHAPQAIMRAGYDAVVAPSYAGIFSDNCAAIGLPAVTVPPEDLQRIAKHVHNDPKEQLTLDIITRKLLVANESISFGLSDATQKAFLDGTWDEMDNLLSNSSKIKELAARLPTATGYKKVA